MSPKIENFQKNIHSQNILIKVNSLTVIMLRIRTGKRYCRETQMLQLH